MSEGATLKAYGAVFGGLLALTAVTVAISYAPLGKTGGIVAAIAVAAGKASLVGAVFMHLKWEKKALYVTFLFPLVLFVIIVCALMPDCVIRHSGEQRPAPSAHAEKPAEGGEHK